MFITRFRLFAQTIGFVVIGLLMVYSLVSIFRNADSALGAGFFAPQPAPVVQTTVFTGTVPSIVSYQGILRDAEGNPLSGIHQMRFRIYADVTAPTTEALWTEEHSQVTVRDGQFTVLLGDLEPIPAAIFQSADRFIGITVDAQDEMVPRQRFAAVPYAMAAAGATYLTAPDATPLKAVTVDNEGNVGVGTESPAAPLHLQHGGQNLHVNGSSLNADTALHVNNSSTTDVSLAAGGGSVGIGTTDPQKALHIQAADPDMILEFAPNSGNVEAELSFREGATVYGAVAYNKSRNGVTIESGGSTRMLVTGDRVGIGTTNPSAALDVTGDIHASGSMSVNGNIRVNGKAPIFIRRYRNLANDNDTDTGISAADYDCVATSWLGNWDINEGGSGISGLWTHVVGNTWYIRAQMSSDSPHERLDVDMLCFLRTMTEYVTPDRRTMNDPN